MKKKDALIPCFIILFFLISIALDWQDASSTEYIISWHSVPPDSVYYKIFQNGEYIGETADTTFEVSIDDTLIHRMNWTVRAYVSDSLESEESNPFSARIVQFMPYYAAETTHIYLDSLSITTIAHPCEGDRISFEVTDTSEVYIDSLEIDYVRDGVVNLSDLAVFAYGYAHGHRSKYWLTITGGTFTLHDFIVLGERYLESGVLRREHAR